MSGARGRKNGNSLLFSIIENRKGFLEVHGDVNIDFFMYTHAIEINKVTLPLPLCSPVEFDKLHGKVNFGVSYH